MNDISEIFEDVSAESAAVEKEPESVVQEAGDTADTDVDYKQFKVLVDGHYLKLATLVRGIKQKDANVLALSKQLAFYRDGVENSLFKAFALEIINYRESCRKSLRDVAERKLSMKEAERYLGYITLELEDVFENLGIRYSGDEIKYNGKNIDDVPKSTAIKEQAPVTEVALSTKEIDSFKSLCAYMQENENAIVGAIANNTILDCLIKDYIAALEVYEHGLYQVVLYPVVRSFVNVYKELCGRIDSVELTEDNATAVYRSELEYTVEKISDVLEKCSVSIDIYVSDVYDSKKQRILKIVDTDDASLNGSIICRYTDCYMMGDKVIYLSKVDVYKAKK